MNKRFVNILRSVACALLGGAMLVGCSKTPVKPENEIIGKLHEDPAKVVLTLTEATLAPGTDFVYANLDKIQRGVEKQVIVWEQKPDASWGFGAQSTTKEFKVKNVEQMPNAVYALDIEYYNKKGELMNRQFIDNGQDKIHQHFFSLYDERKLLIRKADKIPYVYLYADKDQNGKYLGEYNPIGMQGYLRFHKPIGTRAITIDLLHASNSKYQGAESGKTNPYYAASNELRTNSDADISMTFTFTDGTASSDEQPKTPSVPIVSTDKPTGKFPGVNNTNVRKIVLGMYEGHIHKPANYHYVPGPTGFKSKNLSMEQEMTIEYKNGQWEVTSGVNFFLFTKGNLYKGETYPAPVYGLWVDYYDAKGSKLNESFTEKDAYQTFFRPMAVKSFAAGTAMSIKPEELMGYRYRDTTPWDRSTKEGGRYIDETDPLGLKGFFYFHKDDVRFALNLELWSTPKGKKGADGKLSPAVEPSAHVQSTGKVMLSVSIPTYVWLDRNSSDNIEEDTKLDDLPANQRSVVEALSKLLGKSWDEVRADLYLRFYGQRGGENSGRWF